MSKGIYNLMEYSQKNRNPKYSMQIICENCNKLCGCCENRPDGEIKHCDLCTQVCEATGESNTVCSECWKGEENEFGVLPIKTLWHQGRA